MDRLNGRRRIPARRAGRSVILTRNLGTLLIGGWAWMQLMAISSTLHAQQGAPAAPAAKTRTISVMAVVNGEQISREQLAHEALRRYGEEVLETMVNKQLILNECRVRGVTITQQDVDNEIQQYASKFGHTKDQWLELLKQERDLDPDQYGRDIIWPTLALRRLVDGETKVTAEEIAKMMESELGPKVRVRLIALKNKQRAEEVRKVAVAKPAEFGRLAKEYSEDKKSASVRGLIPPIRLHVGDPTVEKVVFSLPEGEISDVVEVAGQFLIFQCVKQIPPSSIDEPYRKQAETKIVEHLREKKTHLAAENLFKRLQNEVKIVNVMNNDRLRQQMPGVAAMIDKTPITIQQLAEECISRHGRDVLLGEINRRLLMQQLAANNVTVQPTDLDAEIARAAESYGYFKPDGTADVEKWLQTVTENDKTSVELYVRDAVWPSVALKKIVGAGIEVSEDDIQKGFLSNYGPRVEVLAIVLGNHRLAQQVWEKARQNSTDEHFGELAFQYSIEPVSRHNYGRVPPIRQHGGRPLIEQEAFALEAGEVSGLLASGDKWVILRCIGRTDPVVKELDESIRKELFTDIYEKKLRLAMAKEFDRIKEEGQIDNYLAGTTQSGKKATAEARVPEERFQRRVPFTTTDRQVQPASAVAPR